MRQPAPDLEPPAFAARDPTVTVSRRALLILAAVCGICGIAAWALWLVLLRGDPGQDWMVFYTAARAYFDGNLALVFDGEKLTAALNQRFAGWLAVTLNLHPWVYPPSFLLMFLPFGLLPPVSSLAVFLVSGFAAALVAAALFVGRGIARWVVAFSLVLCPAVAFNVMTGQNAFFTGALLVGGFGLVERYPTPAGILLGILACKPQLWLMVPVALVAARQWRALAAAMASALALAVLSLIVFGADFWHAWLGLMTGANTAYQAWVTAGRLNGISVFACVRLLGAPQMVADLAQVAAVAIGAAAVFWSFRRPPVDALRLAVLLTATMLAAPHASNSDAVLLALATTFFVVAPRREPLSPAHLALAAAVWICPLVNPPSVFRAGVLTPVLLLLFLAAVVGDIRGARPRPAPPGA